jgi:prepilin-type N-terminal cleavage/methylation domain-containing protein
MKSLFISRLIRANSGFTLAELLLVMGITTVALAIGIPAYHLNIKPTAHLNGAARQLQGDIQLARLRAVSRNVRCGLDFDSTSDDYIVFQDANNSKEYEAGETIEKRTQFGAGFGYRSISFDADYGGDGVTFDNGSGVVNAFSFSARGLPSPGGSIYLKNEKGEGRAIIVNVMGGVRLTKY